MMKLSHKKINFNTETNSFNVSFRMSREVYDTIIDADKVEDLALSILAEMEKEIAPIVQLDSPNLPPIEIKE